MDNPTTKTIANGIVKAVGILAAIALILFFIYTIKSALVYIAIAAILSLIARPINKFLTEKLKFPNILAVSITMILFVSIIYGIISMFIPLIVKQSQNLALLNSSEFQGDIKELAGELNGYLATKGIDVFDAIEHYDFSSQLKNIPTYLNSIVGTLGSITMGLFSVLFITFFFMKDKNLLYEAFLAVTPDEKEERILKALNKISPLLSRYFIGLIIQLTILFAIYSIILLIFGIESAIVIAFLAALLNLIPYVGPLLGGLLMLTLTMTSNLEQNFQTVVLPTTLYVAIGYLIAQLVDNFFSQPIIFSKSVKSHPLEIFLSIIIGGLLFGIVGMIIAVPIYTAIKVILSEFLADNEVVRQLTKDID